MDNWIKTDDNQAIRKITEKSFEVVEVILIAPPDAKNINRFGISHQVVDLDNYSEEEILRNISAFGYKSVDEIKQEYGNAANQIIAECIAENKPEDTGDTFKTEKQALMYIEKNNKRKNFYKFEVGGKSCTL